MTTSWLHGQHFSMATRSTLVCYRDHLSNPGLQLYIILDHLSNPGIQLYIILDHLSNPGIQLYIILDHLSNPGLQLYIILYCYQPTLQMRMMMKRMGWMVRNRGLSHWVSLVARPVNSLLYLHYSPLCR